MSARSAKEKARRRRCLEQAGRIRAYLPTLRMREETLVMEIREVQKLIADELKAYDDLLAEANAPPTRRQSSAA